MPDETPHDGRRRSEPGAQRLWPAALAVLLVGLGYAALPDPLREGPRWLLLATGAVLIVVGIGSHWRGYPRLAAWVGRVATVAVTAGLVASVLLLVLDLQPARIGAVVLLRYAALLWAINIGVFALWYWEVDNGGPHARHSRGYAPLDFAFPQFQLVMPGDPPVHWRPEFVDYLFLAFNTNTAFSPSDTMIMSRRAKLLMMTQSVLALVIITVLAARAISLL